MEKFILYINDNKIFLYDTKKNKIYYDKFKSIKESILLNEYSLEKELDKFLRKNKVFISLFGEKLLFIKTDFMNNLIISKYFEVLNNYFRSIRTVNLKDILLKNNTSYLNINNNYLEYYYIKESKLNNLKIDIKIFNNDLKKLIKHLFNNIYKPNNLVLFGNNNIIPNLSKEIYNKYKIETKYQENYEDYIIDMISKQKFAI